MSTETKSEADIRILTQAKEAEPRNKVSIINIRHTDSQHPLDCHCESCLYMRDKFDDKLEKEYKYQNDLYIGTLVD